MVLEPPAPDHLAIDLAQPAVATRARLQATPGQQLEAVLVPFSGLIVVAQNSARRLRLVREAQRQVPFDQTVQCLGRVAGGLEILDHNAETIDRGRIVVAAQVIAANFHFLAREMVKGEVEFQDRGLGIFAVRIAFDHFAQGLQGLKGQALIAPHLVDLVIVAECQKILGIGRVVIIGIKVDEALRRRSAVGVVLVAVMRKGLHDQRAPRPVGIGIKPFNFREVERGLGLVTLLKLIFATAKDLLGGEVLQRDLLLVKEATRCGATIAATGRQSACHRHHTGQTRYGIAADHALPPPKMPYTAPCEGCWHVSSTIVPGGKMTNSLCVTRQRGSRPIPGRGPANARLFRRRM
mmetsp:Transcript_18269/g.28989  ORF Transcript_18269/g.28989 Transcript_18269/m.28989 type:complete len:351 (+) Transcript_18269:1000-2052(+)